MESGACLCSKKPGKNPNFLVFEDMGGLPLAPGFIVVWLSVKSGEEKNSGEEKGGNWIRAARTET